MEIRKDGLSELQRQINDLQKENGILRDILDRSGIPYHEKLRKLKGNESGKEDFDPDQGTRIIMPPDITEGMAQKFFSRFWGRQDVYAKRSVKQSTGEARYLPQCENFWKPECPQRQKKTGNA